MPASFAFKRCKHGAINNQISNKEEPMSELAISIHAAVSPFNQIFYVVCMAAAASIILTTIKAKQGE